MIEILLIEDNPGDAELVRTMLADSAVGEFRLDGSWERYLLRAQATQHL